MAGRCFGRPASSPSFLPRITCVGISRRKNGIRHLKRRRPRLVGGYGVHGRALAGAGDATLGRPLSQGISSGQTTSPVSVKWVGGKDGSGAWQIINADAGSLEGKNEKEGGGEQEKKANERFGAFVLPRRIKVVWALVDSIYFHTPRYIGVFARIKARTKPGTNLASDLYLLPCMYRCVAGYGVHSGPPPF